MAPEPTTVLRAEGVEVRYTVYPDGVGGLRERVKSPKNRRRVEQSIHAVRGIDLELEAGDVLGIVGRNGSGKSSFLLALAGLLPVTAGEVWALSRPALLGVGSVLNLRLSGRRNLYLGGMAQGLSRAEIDDQIDELVEFTGLGEFIDYPMKAYSSGMRARLNFTVATMVTPEILLIDEALAVGDAEFSAKSAKRLQRIRDAAGVIVMVSHTLPEIERSCTRAMRIEKGLVVDSGEPSEVVARYSEAVG